MVSYMNLTLQNFGSWLNTFYDVVAHVSDSGDWSKTGSWERKMRNGGGENDQKQIGICKYEQKPMQINWNLSLQIQCWIWLKETY